MGKAWRGEVPLRRRDAPGRASSPRRRSTRSTTTSTASPRTTRARGAWPRVSRTPACPSTRTTVETNFVGLEVEPLGLTTEEATERIGAEGVLVGWLRPGVLRLATYLGIEDDDIDAALEAIPRALGVRVA